MADQLGKNFNTLYVDLNYKARCMVDIIQIAAIIIPIVFIVYVVLSSLRIVRPTEKGLVERLGKYHRYVQGGLTFLVPFVDRIVKVNTTERMTPVQRQDVITKDKCSWA